LTQQIETGIGTALPKVGITDYDSNLKVALNEVDASIPVDSSMSSELPHTILSISQFLGEHFLEQPTLEPSRIILASGRG